MSTEEVVRYGDAVLRNPTQNVEKIDDEVRELVDHMIDVMHQSAGVGLAANQIGIPKRIFVYDIGEGPSALINAKITKRSGEEEGVEGCLSIPGLQGDVVRSRVVTTEGLDIEGNRVKIRAEGFLARVFQHEIDHLDGYLFIDKALPDSLSWVTPGQEEDESSDEE